MLDLLALTTRVCLEENKGVRLRCHHQFLPVVSHYTLDWSKIVARNSFSLLVFSKSALLDLCQKLCHRFLCDLSLLNLFAPQVFVKRSLFGFILLVTYQKESWEHVWMQANHVKKSEWDPLISCSMEKLHILFLHLLGYSVEILQRTFIFAGILFRKKHQWGSIRVNKHFHVRLMVTQNARHWVFESPIAQISLSIPNQGWLIKISKNCHFSRSFTSL